jgi:hypothetical protein
MTDREVDRSGTQYLPKHPESTYLITHVADT